MLWRAPEGVGQLQATCPVLLGGRTGVGVAGCEILDVMNSSRSHVIKSDVLLSTSSYFAGRSSGGERWPSDYADSKIHVPVYDHRSLSNGRRHTSPVAMVARTQICRTDTCKSLPQVARLRSQKFPLYESSGGKECRCREYDAFCQACGAPLPSIGASLNLLSPMGRFATLR